jgi:thymidine kinase
MGTLELIIGPMFSGKTSAVIERYNEIKSSDNLSINNILAINYDKDTRYGTNKIISHDGVSIDCLSINELDDINTSKNTRGSLNTATHILINEAQFFKNLKSWVIFQIDYKKKHVVLCGLDSDFKREKFGELLDLIPHANIITKLSGKCSGKDGYCTMPSIFTHRLSFEIEQEVIGNNNYVPLCRECYCSVNS